MGFLGGIVSGVGSLFGASKAASAAKSAANAQVQSAQIAADTQRQMFGEAQHALTPYMQLGEGAESQLAPLIPQLQANHPAIPTMTQADLEATPGYQFTLNQGLKATQNGAAARGLGLSGAALKGAASYATGLSDQTYNTRFGQAQQQYQDQVTNQTNDYNRLYQATGLGAEAGGALAGTAIRAGQGIASSQTGAGNAQAAGINAGGQAWASGIQGAASGFNNALNSYLYGGSQGGLYGSSGSNRLLSFAS